MPFPALSERDVTKQIKGFLEWKGWRPLRMATGGFTRPQGGYQPFGEQGQPDWLFVYYLQPPEALVLWVEMKSPGDRRKCPTWCRNRNVLAKKLCSPCGQAQWRAEEERRGGTVVQTASFDEFSRFYHEQFAYLHGPNAPRKGTVLDLPFGGEVK